jgi:hypothetical protein
VTCGGHSARLLVGESIGPLGGSDTEASDPEATTKGTSEDVSAEVHVVEEVLCVAVEEAGSSVAPALKADDTKLETSDLCHME